MLGLTTNFDLHKIAMPLQEITQWFGNDVIINYEVVTRDRLHEIEQCREEPDPSPKFRYHREKFWNSDILCSTYWTTSRKSYAMYCKSIGWSCKPTSRMIGSYGFQKFKSKWW